MSYVHRVVRISIPSRYRKSLSLTEGLCLCLDDGPITVVGIDIQDRKKCRYIRIEIIYSNTIESWDSIRNVARDLGADKLWLTIPHDGEAIDLMENYHESEQVARRRKPDEGPGTEEDGERIVRV